MTNTVTEITDAGIVLDGRTLMAGTRLVTKSAPHPSWLNVGRVVGQVTEQRLEVASPAKEGMESKGEYQAELQKDERIIAHSGLDITLETARIQYEQAIGKKPHHKAKLETLIARIEESQQG